MTTQTNDMARFFLSFLVLTLLMCSTSNSDALSPTQAFNQAKNTYRFGDYKKAVQLLNQLLYPKPGRLQSKFLRHEAQMILGISYYYLYGKIGETITALKSKGQTIPENLKKQHRDYLRRSRFELLNYLSENENARLSSLTYQPDLVSFFNQLRKINKERIARAKTSTKKRKQTQVKIIYSQTERRIYQTPLILALLPCGIPQFYSGHHAKGTAIVVGCTLAIGVYFGSYAWLYSLQNERGLFPQDKILLANQLQVVHITALVTLGAIALYGYVDGFIFFQTKRESINPIVPQLKPTQFGSSVPSQESFRLQFQ